MHQISFEHLEQRPIELSLYQLELLNSKIQQGTSPVDERYVIPSQLATQPRNPFSSNSKAFELAIRVSRGERLTERGLQLNLFEEQIEQQSPSSLDFDIAFEAYGGLMKHSDVCPTIKAVHQFLTSIDTQHSLEDNPFLDEKFPFCDSTKSQFIPSHYRRFTFSDLKGGVLQTWVQAPHSFLVSDKGTVGVYLAHFTPIVRRHFTQALCDISLIHSFVTLYNLQSLEDLSKIHSIKESGTFLEVSTNQLREVVKAFGPGFLPLNIEPEFDPRLTPPFFTISCSKKYKGVENRVGYWLSIIDRLELLLANLQHVRFEQDLDINE